MLITCLISLLCAAAPSTLPHWQLFSSHQLKFVGREGRVGDGGGGDSHIVLFQFFLTSFFQVKYHNFVVTRSHQLPLLTHMLLCTRNNLINAQIFLLVHGCSYQGPIILIAVPFQQWITWCCCCSHHQLSLKVFKLHFQFHNQI